MLGSVPRYFQNSDFESFFSPFVKQKKSNVNMNTGKKKKMSV